MLVVGRARLKAASQGQPQGYGGQPQLITARWSADPSLAQRYADPSTQLVQPGPPLLAKAGDGGQQGSLAPAA